MRGWGGIYTQPPKTSPLGWFLRPCRIFRHVQKDLQNSNFNSQARNFRQRVGTCNCESEHSQSPWEDPHRNFQRGSEVPTVRRNMHTLQNIHPSLLEHWTGTSDGGRKFRHNVGTCICSSDYWQSPWELPPRKFRWWSEVPTEGRIFRHTQRQSKIKSLVECMRVWYMFISKLKSC